MHIHPDVIAALAKAHPRLGVDIRNPQCGPGWLELVDELLTEIDRLADSDQAKNIWVVGLAPYKGGLTVTMFWDMLDPDLAVLQDMQKAIWRRSRLICELCGVQSLDGVCSDCILR